ncbi:hypothetical protein J4479_01160 [Candidatus Woesearchaeota archaeon]|nr:hypothetical protein [Candidatus Woesearchaeota archaeon]
MFIDDKVTTDNLFEEILDYHPAEYHAAAAAPIPNSDELMNVKKEYERQGYIFNNYFSN